MSICFNCAFCTSRGEITENVFASMEDAEMWASRISRGASGTLYIREGECWVPDMVFGLSDDDVSVLARGMAFVSAIDGGDYGTALEDYLSCEEMLESIKESLRAELRG